MKQMKPVNSDLKIDKQIAIPKQQILIQNNATLREYIFHCIITQYV